MNGTLTIMIVGGYGTFGGRIVELLESEARLTLIVAGRSLAKAEAFCLSRHPTQARLLAARFDRDGDVNKQLTALKLDLLIDASGPFQAYGRECYRLIEACIAARIPYLDLADGSAFVGGVAQFDEAAKAADIYVLSGVSSFPVLTAAVVRHLSRDMTRVLSIHGGIAPSPFAGVGLNVIRAIASYSGRPVTLRKNGGEATGYPLTEHLRYTIAPPGYDPLDYIWFSLVDVPDLQALAWLWPEADTIWMGAGPVPEILHRFLAGLARLVRWRILPSLTPLAPLMHFVSNHLRWGAHRGGMFVEVSGETTAESMIKRSWHLLAEGEDGPLIPSMAVEALVRKKLSGLEPKPGARAATRDLELSDYDHLFRLRTIYTGERESTDEDKPLYARLLGPQFDNLPEPIRAMHRAQGRTSIATGRARVERGTSLLSKFAAALFGFPKAGENIDIAVRFSASEDGEIWQRNFNGRKFSSRQYAGTGRNQHLLCECFGPLVFAMALVIDGARLRLVLRHWSAFGLPLPLWLGPRSNSYESVEDGRFTFHVEISHPFTGLIVRYRGWLA